MDTYSSECYDSVALFLCIHIVHRYKVIMHKRNAPVLDKSVAVSYSLYKLLYPSLILNGTRCHAITGSTTRCALYIGYSIVILFTPTSATLYVFDSERIKADRVQCIRKTSQLELLQHGKNGKSYQECYVRE